MQVFNVDTHKQYFVSYLDQFGKQQQEIMDGIILLLSFKAMVKVFALYEVV